MIQESKILSLAKKNRGVVTTKEVSNHNIARTYLTKLVNEHKLYRVERGIYSTFNKKIDLFYKIQNSSKKIVFSHFTSLDIQGFYKNIDITEQLSIPQGYNAKNYSNYKLFYNHLNNYQKGMIKYKYNDYTINVYDIERSICDIIKDRHRFDESKYNKFINFYFNKTDINYSKLLEYSKMLHISPLVHHYLSLFKA